MKIEVNDREKKIEGINEREKGGGIMEEDEGGDIMIVINDGMMEGIEMIKE